MKVKLIAGVDEAGRGPLAGPVVAAAVILDPAAIPEGLKDSKKLSEKKREEIALVIKDQALAIGVGVVHEQEIDRSNILKATLKAMHLAVLQLEKTPDLVKVDGNHAIPDLPMHQKTIIGGDASEMEISAASIIAKTTRDKMMISYAKLFPEYGFASHKGYGSKIHMEKLNELGRCPIHRRSFAPVTKSANEHYRYFRMEEAYGKMGELIAGMYLVRNGYHLVEHSYHAGRDGELDLIATHGDLLVFIEVKSFAGSKEDTEALERVTPLKQNQVAATATGYLQAVPWELDEYRFDIITVNFSTPQPTIQHYIDAFTPL